MAVLAVPKLFPPTVGAEGGMCRRVCTWGFVNLCVAQEHTTHLLSTQMLWVFETLLSAYTCQLVLTQD